MRRTSRTSFTDTSPRRALHVIVPGVPSDDVGDTWIEQWAVVAQRRFRGVAVHDVSDRQIGGGPGAGFSDLVLVVPFRSSAQAMAVIEDVCNEFPELADGHGERWTAVVPSTRFAQAPEYRAFCTAFDAFMGRR